MPPGDLLRRVEPRDRPDLEPHVLQLGPGAAEELDGGADSQVEAVQTPVEGRERGTDDFASPQAPVSAVPSTAPGSDGGMRGAATGHDESLGGAGVCGAASPGCHAAVVR